MPLQDITPRKYNRAWTLVGVLLSIGAVLIPQDSSEHQKFLSAGMVGLGSVCLIFGSRISRHYILHAKEPITFTDSVGAVARDKDGNIKDSR
jgi:hypothetical protein